MLLNKQLLFKILLPVFVFVSFKTTYAQDTSANKLPGTAQDTSVNTLPANLRDTLSKMLEEVKNDPNGKGKFPTAVLVELRAERNRINVLTKEKKYELLEEVKKDAVGARNATIKDFEENFHYCPVYYFIDTNADLVKEKKFDGILLNADGSPANAVVKDKYVIAYYGYLSTKYKKRQNKEDSLRRETDAEVPFGRGLLIADDKFRVLTYFYEEGYDNIFWGLKNRRKDIRYVSRHFDIEYYPFVKLFNVKLVNRQYRIEFWRNYVMYQYDLSEFRSTKVPKKNTKEK